MAPSSYQRFRTSRGSVLPIVLVILIVLLGVLACALDIGRVAVCRTQLQNAADSAALAGASGLATDNLILPYKQGRQNNDIASARALAQKFAQANTCDMNGSRAIQLDPNADVDIGILSNPTDLTSSFDTSGSVPFNSVRVRTNIDPAHGGNLNFLVAPVLNQHYTTVQMSATATVQLYKVGSSKVIVGARSPILPITMSNSDWQQMVNNQTGQDNYAFDLSTGRVVNGSDGLDEQQLYPGSNVSSSNSGLIQFGTGSRSDSVLADQIINGPTSSQVIQQWPPNGLPPWNAQHQFTIGADSGWRATDFDALASAIGEVRLIPINDGTPPGNGANGTYNIIALAPVRIMYSSKGGKSGGYALVQPAVINDPSVIPGSTLAGPGQGGVPVYRLTR